MDVTGNRPPAGIYLHWPFCERKCPYCDFYTFGRDHHASLRRENYAEALAEEIRSAPGRLGPAARSPIDTIYFGGGTPSLMDTAALERLMEAIGEVFSILPGAEITLEVNPTAAEASRVGEWIAAGINRFSIGCQSFNDRVLSALGRVHDAATARSSLDAMRRGGAQNISIDLIVGAPTQSPADLAADLDELAELAPEHVSAYDLTIHEGTPLARLRHQGRLALPPERDQAAMFELIIDRLAAAGFEHYEVSNWARPGRRSRHNSKYWRDADVLGFGVSAHGVAGGRRFVNPADLEEYLQPESRRLAIPSDLPAGQRARHGEIMMLALRRVGGVGWDELEAWLGDDARALYGPELDRLAGEGLIEDPAAGLRLTRRGILLSDSVAVRCF